jgi:hypothetical protein
MTTTDLSEQRRPGSRTRRLRPSVPAQAGPPAEAPAPEPPAAEPPAAEPPAPELAAAEPPAPEPLNVETADIGTPDLEPHARTTTDLVPAGEVIGAGAALDQLAASLRPALGGVPGAPDPDEVAAALEAAGLTDQSARQSFGQPDLFALAGRLLPRLARATRPRKHAVAPVRLDWSGLLRTRFAAPRLVAAGALVVAALWLRVPMVAVLPTLVAVPLAELLLAWRLGYVSWGLGYHNSSRGWRAHLRRSGMATLMALTVPLLLAAGVAGAATHRPGLVPLACGLAAAGGYPLLLVLAARHRLLTGVSLVAVTAAGTVLIHPSLPRMGLLAVGYLVGLGLTAYAVLDPRSRD